MPGDYGSRTGGEAQGPLYIRRYFFCFIFNKKFGGKDAGKREQMQDI